MTPYILISRHLRATGLSPTRFGREAAGDPRLVGDLRRGRAPRAELWGRIEAYMRATAHLTPSTVPSSRRSRRGWASSHD